MLPKPSSPSLCACYLHHHIWEEWGCFYSLGMQCKPATTPAQPESQAGPRHCWLLTAAIPPALGTESH